MSDRKKKIIGDIKRIIVPVLKERGIKHSSVFGSCARGDAKENSDIDLLVDLPEDYSLLNVADLKAELESSIGRAVDLVEYDAIKPAIKGSVLDSQVEIL